MSGRGKVVCVTGATGFVASWVVKFLLHRGYTVNATVRDPNDPKKTEHLFSLDGAKERLHLFKADLLEEGSFDHAVDGCEGVFHMASPVLMTVADPQAELIDPALKGTLNVLRSCANVPSVKRVVLTSSIVAVVFTGKPHSPDAVIDETCFSDPSLCEKLKLWYPLSKTLAEEAAWKFAEENGISLVSINPGMAIGPLLQPTLNSSSEPILKLINGTEKYPNISYRWADVRDIANAHILAFETPSASGRYSIVGSVSHCSEAVKILRNLFSDLNLPEKCEDDQPLAPAYEISRQRAEILGVEFTPLEVSLKDTVESLKAKNFF